MQDNATLSADLDGKLTPTQEGGQTMFEPLQKGSDSSSQIRVIAILLGAASLILFIACYVWYEIKGSEYEEPLFPYYPSDIETGLIYGAILGGVLAIGLFTYSYIIEEP
jgi:hypothetical protein